MSLTRTELPLQLVSTTCSVGPSLSASRHPVQVDGSALAQDTPLVTVLVPSLITAACSD
ncbi:hypothetical protein TIFTF001_030002 [Ficus carica]|uniref:Uncharacterized protein n=1 Tax=Ficus carica TaxID=3494 RepID=A0AA88J4A4_FICCA|nr:hypothetical protein TIFTF001_030002 [Ficus carica]